MKYSYKPSPNYRSPQTTSGIMFDLIICLLSIHACSAVYYGLTYGSSYGFRVVLMAFVSVACALMTEYIYYTLIMNNSKMALETLPSSGIVTALILTLITRLDVSYYALGMATIIAIVFGKLIFGGFGQNIFNPAAVGEAVIMNYFASSKAVEITADVYSGATPMGAMNSAGWVLSNTAMSGFLKQFGGLQGLLLGGYPSVIGGTFTLIIIICGIYLIYRKDIDWRMPVTYIGMIFGISLIVGLIKGSGLAFAGFNVLGGGVLFGAVFMLTDPVTSPVGIPGRVVYAAGAAMLTLLIRWKANLPEGVLFSILLMNMLSPAIEKIMSGNQIKDAKKLRNWTMIAVAVCALIPLLVGISLKPSGNADEVPDVAPIIKAGINTEEFDVEQACAVLESDGSKTVYECSAKGFEGVNEAKITVDNGAIVSVEVTAFNDTEGVGDAAITAEALAKYEGLTLTKSVDVTSGATFTNTSLKAMAQKALRIYAGEDTAAESLGTGNSDSKDSGTETTAAVTAGSLGSETFDVEAACRVYDNTTAKTVYKCSAKGYEGVNEATVTVENDAVVSVEVTAFNDTEGVGDAAITAEALAKYEGLTLAKSVDVTSGATFTSTSLKAMVQKALTMNTGK